jgi:hypothetical protein
LLPELVGKIILGMRRAARHDDARKREAAAQRRMDRQNHRGLLQGKQVREAAA